MVSTMLVSAQEHGQMAETLAHLADFYRDRARHALRVVREFFEPLLLLLVGLCVAWILISIYIPIFTVYRNALGNFY